MVLSVPGRQLQQARLAAAQGHTQPNTTTTPLSQDLRERFMGCRKQREHDLRRKTVRRVVERVDPAAEQFRGLATIRVEIHEAGLQHHAVPNGEYGQGSSVAFPVEAQDIPALQLPIDDLLLLQGELQLGDEITQSGSLFELHGLREPHHPGSETLDELTPLSLQPHQRSGEDLTVVLGRRVALYAWSNASPELMQHARATTTCQHTIGAGAEREGPL